MKQNWTYKKLGEVATFSRGLTYAKGDVADESTKKVLRSNNIDLSSHSLVFDDVAYLKEDFIIPDEKKLHKGDIFICMSNGSTQHLGKVAFIEDDIDYAFGGFMGAIHPNQNEVFPKFVFYACLSQEYRSFLASIFNGVNINNLKWSDLSTFSIPVSPLATQSRIVSELDLLQSIIDKQQAQLKELDTLAQSVFYDMFGDPVTQTNFQSKDLASITKSSGGGTPSKAHPEYWDGNIPWVSSKDMKSTYIGDSQLHITNEGVENSSAKKLPIGTILLVTRSGILKHTLPIAITTAEVTVNQDLKALIVNNSICNSIYLLYCLKAYSPYLLGKTKAVTVDSIDFSIFKKLSIPLPPLSLQQSFSSKIESIEKQKATIAQSIAETQKLFNYTMDKYFG